ncbi:MAG: hypothetical protein FWD53_09060 [Phycisphaerales bacterium]|nr:hypothetical protein [Phycisphaerales bacterium]
MEILQRYLARVQAQLKGLTISQRLLVGLLVVVMAGTIYFLVLWSAKPEMVALNPLPMSAEEISRAETYLKSSQHKYEVVGDKIMVPAAKVYAITGAMLAAQVLPDDTTAIMARLIENDNFFKPDAQKVREWTWATQETLARILRLFPYIENSKVIIARGERPGLGRAAVPSSASVWVKVQGGESLTQKQVVAIVDIVRRAVPGLGRDEVTLSDGKQSYRVPSDDTPMPSDLLEFKRVYENELERKLYLMFRDIPTVKIAVNAVPDMSVRNIRQMEYSSKPVRAIQEETSKESTTEGGSSGGEPGVRLNVGATVENSSGRRTSQTTNDSTSRSIVKIGETETATHSPAGTEWKNTTASISIPRSYLVACYRRVTKDAKFKDPSVDPDDDDPEFKQLVATTIKTAKDRAATAIGITEENGVWVDWFDDTIELRPAEASIALASMGGSGMPALVAQYAKQGILALVALGALGMMLMMVRRAVPVSAEADVSPAVFFGGATNGNANGRRRRNERGQFEVTDEDVVGEANEGDAVLTGIELDDETLQSRKMVDEVSTMIKENPENAASLVKRWLAKSN